MAVLIRPIEAQRGIDVGGVANTRVDGSVGEAMQGLGRTLQGAGNLLADLDLRRERMKQEDEDFTAEQEFQRFQTGVATGFDETRQQMPASGEGFTDTVSTQFNERWGQFVKNIPERLRSRFDELGKTSREQWLARASAAQMEQRGNWYRTGINERLETLQGQVFDNPDQFDAAKQDIYRTIDASGLSPVEKEARRKKADETFAVAVGERQVRDAEANPESATDAAARLGVPAVGNDTVDVVVGKIIGVESGGRANAKNPNSSASGLGQFIDSTWLTMVKKYRPDVAAGRSNGEILSLKGNAQLGREMTKRYTQENAAGLRSAGLPVTPGTLYLAHFAGIGGARAVLRSGDGAALSSVLGPQVIKANGFLAGKTTGWLKDWAAKKMGDAKGVPSNGGEQGAPADPRYASLNLSQRLAIYDRTQAAAQRGQSMLDAQTSAAKANEYDNLTLGIRTGQVVSEQQIMSASLIDNGQRATLIQTLRSERKDADNIQMNLQAFQAGSLSVDPYSSEGKKAVDGVGKFIASSVPQEQQQAAVEELVRQSGTVPQSTLNQLREGLAGTDVATVMAAAQAAQRIATVDPAALGRRDGGGEVQKAADEFSHYVSRLNLDPQAAAKRMIESRDPAKQRERKALEPAAKEFLKKAGESDLTDMFDDAWFEDPSIGALPGQEAGIKADYLALAEDAFYEANGDPERAKAIADGQMKALYGVTRIGGPAMVMKYPPERFWPASKMLSGSSEKSLGYASKQLRDDVAASFPDVDPSSIVLFPTAKTEQEVKAGRIPGYAVMFKDANGNYQTVLQENGKPRLWKPEIDRAMRFDQQAAQNAIGEARAYQAQELQKLPYNQATPDDFLGGTDSLQRDLDALKSGDDQQSAPKPMAPSKGDTLQNRLTEQRGDLLQNMPETSFGSAF